MDSMIPPPTEEDRKLNLELIYKMCEAMSPAPWSDGLDMDPPDGRIESEGCCVCTIQDHGNVNTIMRTGEHFSHADARGIANARNVLPAVLRLLAEAQQKLEK